MNGRAVLQKDNTQVSSFRLGDLSPAAYPAIGLNLLMLQQSRDSLNPRQINRRTIRALTCDKEILRKFHRQCLTRGGLSHPTAVRLLGAAEGFEHGEDFGETLFPRAFAGEAGGEGAFVLGRVCQGVGDRAYLFGQG